MSSLAPGYGFGATLLSNRAFGVGVGAVTVYPALIHQKRNDLHVAPGVRENRIDNRQLSAYFLLDFGCLVKYPKQLVPLGRLVVGESELAYAADKCFEIEQVSFECIFRFGQLDPPIDGAC